MVSAFRPKVAVDATPSVFDIVSASNYSTVTNLYNIKRDFTLSRIDNNQNRAQMITTASDNLERYIARLEDLAEAALSPNDLLALTQSLTSAGFTITENRPLNYKDKGKMGVALVANKH